jgi:hypothetical protein
MSGLRALISSAEAFARNAGPALVAGRELVAASTALHRSLRGSAAAQYRATHGEIEPLGVEMVDVADPAGGLVELGELDAVLYWADKGNGPERFVHDFGDEHGRKVGALPILCFARDGSGLVIARGRSLYRVTAHGIEG